MSQDRFGDLASRLTPEALGLFREMAAAHLESTGDRFFLFSATFSGTSLNFTGKGSTRQFSGVDQGALEDLVDEQLLRVDYGPRGTPNYRVTGEGQYFYRWLMQNEGSVVGLDPQAAHHLDVGSEETNKNVFVVHGRNTLARDAMFTFLRSIGLCPIEWDEAVAATGEASPYIGKVLDAAFDRARAVVVLLTPDEVTYLRHEYASGPDDPESQPAPQARPNVLFEAGMAMGRNPNRTVLVELGAVREFSDIAGRHTVRLSNDSEQREALVKRLETSGCKVDRTRDGWRTAGDFCIPPPPGGAHSVGTHVPPVEPNSRPRIRLNYFGRSASGKLTISNVSDVSIENLDINIPKEVPNFVVSRDDLPIEELPPRERVTIDAFGTREGGKGHFFLDVTYDDDVAERVFLNLDR